jgi:hypothetical protein
MKFGEVPLRSVAGAVPQNPLAILRASIGLSASKGQFLNTLVPGKLSSPVQAVSPSQPISNVPNSNMLDNEEDEMVDNSAFDAIDFDAILQQTIEQKTPPLTSSTTTLHTSTPVPTSLSSPSVVAAPKTASVAPQPVIPA